jgi:drug/metabolite transporter (DMT)-like permease
MAASRVLPGTLLVVGAATLWGVNGTVSTAVMEAGLSPARLAEARVALAGVLLVAWLVVRDRDALRLDRREALAFAAFGVIGLLGVQWTYFEAISRIPVGVSLVIEYTAPLLVALWVRFAWRRALPWQVWVAIPVAIAGLALVLGVSGIGAAGLDPLGVAWSLAAAFCYAYYVLHGESLMRRRSPVAVLGIGLGFAAIALSIALPWWSFPWSALALPVDGLPGAPPMWPLILYTVLLGTIAPFAMLLAGVRLIGADGASVTAMLEPIVAGAVAWAILGQALGPLQVAGGLIVLAAVAVAQTARARAERL